jgi:signal transduction histidine kinase
LLEEVEKRHPIACHFFILQGNAVRFPLLRTPPRRQIDSYITRENGKTGERFARLFAEGEDRELRQPRPDQALSFYRQCHDLPASDWLKALALARVARCLQKTNQAKAAEQAYLALAERYGNLYDVFHRPYALIAAFELDDLARRTGDASAISFTNLYHDLVHGRWELSADQLDHFRVSLKERSENLRTKINNTEYLSHLEMARALHEGFRHYGPLHAGEVYANAFTDGETSYQTLYTLLPAEPGTETLLGFAVDLNWVESQLLPECISELDVDKGFVVALKAGQNAATSTNASAEPVIFKAVFPFWQLSIVPASVAAWETTTQKDMLVFTGATLIIFSTLILGVVLLMRDVSRELKLGRLRADFISGVSHELKTPLTLIRLYAETLLHGKRFQEKERRDFYQIITRESERLSHLIEKVLDFSCIDRGQKQYNLQEGDLAQVAGRTVEIYGEYLKRQGFLVETDLATHLPPVQFDADAVSEAILNLMDNAAKYSGESKFVGVRLWPEDEDSQVIFEVEDHGIGIPASEHEKIFAVVIVFSG